VSTVLAGAPPTALRTKEVTIYLGGVHASDEPLVIKTLLGSCIAVCLWDPEGAIGGMNHFMLPHGAAGSAGASRFGVHAMDCLIGAMMKLGGDRRRFVAKVFGGADVLDVAEAENSVSQQNITFARAFLGAEGVPLVSEDVGGHHARLVNFHVTSGRAFVRRLAGAGARARVVRHEVRGARTAPSYGDVTLWE
jgi:chemotaxis receptor (MCP) glutamine deamidase CheD